MPVSMQDVRAVLEQDEPNYQEAAARFGAEALPHLVVLAQSDDAMLASKATYLAAFINEAQTADVLAQASRSTHPVVRVAAAGALRFTEHVTDEVFKNLTDDQDIGVRKTALQSFEISPQLQNRAPMREKVIQLATQETETSLRELAVRLSDRLR